MWWWPRRQLLRLLREGTISEREDAADKCRISRVHQAVPLLIEALEDPHLPLRQRAYSALNGIHSDWSNRADLPKLVNRLSEDLRDGQPLVRQFGISVLGALRTEVAIRPLLKHLLTGQDDVIVLEALQRLSTRWGKTDQARDMVPLLIDGITDQKSAAILGALKEIGDLRAVPLLIRHLPDQKAVQALDNTVSDWPRAYSSEIAEHLRQLLKPPHTRPQAMAVLFILKRADTAEAATLLMNTAIKHDDSDVRREALRSLPPSWRDLPTVKEIFLSAIPVLLLQAASADTSGHRDVARSLLDLASKPEVAQNGAKVISDLCLARVSGELVRRDAIEDVLKRLDGKAVKVSLLSHLNAALAAGSHSEALRVLGALNRVTPSWGKSIDSGKLLQPLLTLIEAEETAYSETIPVLDCLASDWRSAPAALPALRKLCKAYLRFTALVPSSPEVSLKQIGEAGSNLLKAEFHQDYLGALAMRLTGREHRVQALKTLEGVDPQWRTSLGVQAAIPAIAGYRFPSEEGIDALREIGSPAVIGPLALIALAGGDLCSPSACYSLCQIWGESFPNPKVVPPKAGSIFSRGYSTLGQSYESPSERHDREKQHHASVEEARRRLEPRIRAVVDSWKDTEQAAILADLIAGCRAKALDLIASPRTVPAILAAVHGSFDLLRSLGWPHDFVEEVRAEELRSLVENETLPEVLPTRLEFIGSLSDLGLWRVRRDLAVYLQDVRETNMGLIASHLAAEGVVRGHFPITDDLIRCAGMQPDWPKLAYRALTYEVSTKDRQEHVGLELGDAACRQLASAAHPFSTRILRAVLELKDVNVSVYSCSFQLWKEVRYSSRRSLAGQELEKRGAV